MSAVLVGRVGRPHGIDGEMYVDRVSLSAAELQRVAEFEWRGLRGATRVVRVTAARDAHHKLLVRFAGIGSREDAALLTNGELWADAARLPDPGAGMAYTYQLVGLRAVDASGADLGTVKDLLTATAQPLYVLVRDGRERLVPGIEPFVRKVDLAAGVITFDLPPGFEELDT